MCLKIKTFQKSNQIMMNGHNLMYVKPLIIMNKCSSIRIIVQRKKFKKKINAYHDREEVIHLMIEVFCCLSAFFRNKWIFYFQIKTQTFWLQWAKPGFVKSNFFPCREIELFHRNIFNYADTKQYCFTSKYYLFQNYITRW
jgi:hypothetical protein